MNAIMYESEISAWLVLLIVPIFWLYYALQKRRNSIVSKYVNLPHMIPQRQRRFYWLQVISLCVAYFFAAICMMQPTLSDRGAKDEKYEGLDEVAFVLDVSRSMGVQDGSQGETRFARAKEIIQQVSNSIGGVNVSLYAFQTDTENVVPATFDYLYFQLALKNSTIGSTEIPGTDFTNLVEALKAQYLDAKVRKKVRFICLTDGEDTSLFGLPSKEVAENRASLQVLLNQFRDAEMNWLMIGLGTTAGGLVPGLDKVVSHMSLDTIRAFREATNGKMYLASEMNLQDIIDGVVENLQPSQKSTGESLQKSSRQLYFYPLLIVCFFLLLHLLIPEEVKYV